MKTLPKINRHRWLALWAQGRRRRRLRLSSVSPATGLLAGLVGYWNLDELSGDAIDATGITGNLEDVGGVSVAMGGNMAGLNARQLSVGNYLSTYDDPATLKPNDRTLNVWVYRDPGGADFGSIWAKDDYLVGNRGIFCDMDANNAFSYESYDVEYSMSGVGRTQFGLWDLAEWHMVTTVFTESGFTMYFDGVEVDSAVLDTYADTSGTNTLQLGVRRCDSDGSIASDTYLTGRMSNFGLWNVALTPTQVEQLYNGGLGLTYYEL